MTPDEQAELLRLIEQLERGGGPNRRWLNMQDLRRLAGEEIDEAAFNPRRNYFE